MLSQACCLTRPSQASLQATALERSFASAWIAFGHAFAAQDESDQVRKFVVSRAGWIKSIKAVVGTVQQ